jgi:hypothetical protein
MMRAEFEGRIPRVDVPSNQKAKYFSAKAAEK